jgi:tRNA pseudouridine55 synthase
MNALRLAAMPATPCGLLNLNKPAGMTSRRVVDMVKRLVRPAKVGHAGTLDPLATGVLVVPVGAATRLVEYVQQMPKRYRATFLLGRHSPTEDTDGEVIELDRPPVPSLDQIAGAAESLTGPIRQRPPAYSALKVRGRRAYDLARAGESPRLEPRTVVVHRIEIDAFDYPELKLTIECGSGTYIRSLGRDLAESLSSAAVMSALVRTAIGSFRIEEALDPNDLNPRNWIDHLRPPLAAVERLPRVNLTTEEVALIRAGRTIRSAEPLPPARDYAGVEGGGHLVAILTPRGERLLGPKRNMPPDRSFRPM